MMLVIQVVCTPLQHPGHPIHHHTLSPMCYYSTLQLDLIWHHLQPDEYLHYLNILKEVYSNNDDGKPCIIVALIPCLAAYILPSSPVLLHIYCPHPLSCCICTALVSQHFGTAIPTSFSILMEMFLLSCLYIEIPC